MDGHSGLTGQIGEQVAVGRRETLARPGTYKQRPDRLGLIRQRQAQHIAGRRPEGGNNRQILSLSRPVCGQRHGNGRIR